MSGLPVVMPKALRAPGDAVEVDQGLPYADYFDDDGYIIRQSAAWVIREVTFFGAEDDGTIEGLDLDGTVMMRTMRRVAVMPMPKTRRCTRH